MKIYITLYDYRPNYTDKRIRIHPIVQDLGKEPILQILCKILLMGNSEKMLWITTWLWVSNGFKVVINLSIFSIMITFSYLNIFMKWNNNISFNSNARGSVYSAVSSLTANVSILSTRISSIFGRTRLVTRILLRWKYATWFKDVSSCIYSMMVFSALILLT